VWRVKWITLPSGCCYLAAACMHGGSALIDASSMMDPTAASSSRVYRHFDASNEKTLVYGIDLISSPESATTESSQFTFASCSFYENKVQIWDLDVTKIFIDQ
jgi:hypothetical protein